MHALSPSRIAVAALNVPMVGNQCADTRHTSERCAVCGGPIHEHEPFDSDFKLPNSFTSWASLADEFGHVRCGACTAIQTNQVFQGTYGSGLFSKDGFRQALKRSHRAWLIRNLPAPPFIFVIQTTRSQHTVWRAPITTSVERIYVRVGEQLMTARMPLLRQAADEARNVLWPAVAAMRQAALDEQLTKGKKKKTAKPIEVNRSPFITEAIEWKTIGAGMLKPQIAQVFSRGILSLSNAPATFSVNAAEAWLLDAMLNDQPEEPPLITSLA